MAKTKTAAPKAAKTAAPVKPVEEKKTEAVKNVAVKKEEPKKDETAVEKKEAPKAAPKKTEAAAEKMAAPKKAVAEKKAAPKTAAKKPADKKVTKETAVKAAVTLQINGIDYDPASIENDAIAAAKKIKATVKDVKIYINADESAAYFTIDGEGGDDYKINL